MQAYCSRMTCRLRAENIALLYCLIGVFQIPETSKPSTPRPTGRRIQCDSGISQRTKSTETFKKEKKKNQTSLPQKSGEKKGLTVSVARLL